LTGTSTPATIYSDNASTPLANPFTADAYGHWYFYAANGAYDITISGGGLSSPYTLGAVILFDPSESTLTISAAGVNYPNAVSVRESDKLGPLLADLRDWGCVADSTPTSPGTDNTTNFQRALDAVSSQTGGGGLWLPPETNLFGVASALTVPSNVQLLGHGYQSAILRLGNIAAGSGLLNFSGSNCRVRDIRIDGNVTTPVGLLYSSFGSDPYSALLTDNSSIWVHSGASQITFESGFIEHTGGYGMFIDAENADISDIEAFAWWFRNNRPHLFGTSAGDLNYGSWTGGLFWRGGGSFRVHGLSVRGCHWRRATGNCLWGHLTNFSSYHTNVNLVGNDFQDIGLDGILMGGVYGGSVTANILHRVGYTTLTDTDTPNPRYLAGLSPTAIDGGFSIGVDYTANLVTSVNGDAYDLDGHQQATVSANVGVIPLAGSPQYTEDSIVLYGPNQNGVNVGDGIVGGNSQLNGGSQYITVADNVLINFGNCGIVAGSAKYWQIIGNKIFHPNTALAPPIQLYSIGGIGSEGLCTLNVVEHNLITYAGAQPFVKEVGTGWAGTAINRCFDNTCIGSSAEFSPDASSGSYTGFSIGNSSWVERGGSRITLAGQGSNSIALDMSSGYAKIESLVFTQESAPPVSSAGQSRLYMDSTTHTVKMSQNGGAYVALGTGGGGGGTPGSPDKSVQFNLAGVFGGDGDFTWDTSSGSGVLTVGHAGSTAGINVLSTQTNSVQTLFGGVTAKYLITTDSVFFIEEAAPALSSAGQTRLYMDSTSHILKASVNGGAYVPVISAGSVAGSNTQVQFNNSGAFGASADFTWASPTLTLGNASGGINVLSTGTNAVQAINGGVTAKYLITPDSLFFVEEAAPALSSAGQTRFYMDSSSHTMKVSQNGAAYVSLVATASVAGSDKQVQYNNSGAFGASADFAWDNAAHSLTLGNAAGGLNVLSTGTNAIQAALGGVTAKYLITPAELVFVEEAAPSLSIATQTRFYMDSTSHVMMVSMNGAAYVPVVASGSVAGSTTQVQYNNAGAFGASADFTWDNSAHSLTLGNVAGGLNVISNGTNAIQAVNGGVTAKFLITSDSVFFIQEAAPALSSAGQSRLYMDSTTHTVLISQNGGAYVALVGAGSVAGSNTQVQYNASGAFGASSDFTWDNSGHTLALNNAAGGLNVLSSGTNAVQAVNGGVTSKWHIATDSYFFIEESAPAVSASGQSRLYMDSSTHKVRISQNAGAYADLVTSASVVTSLTASTGINVSASTGAITITNIGVTSLNGNTGAVTISAGSGISVGAGPTVSNTGVLSVQGSTGSVTLVAGTGVSIAGLTISIGQAVSTSSNVTFANVTANNYTTAGTFQALPPLAASTTFQVFRAAVNWTLIDGQGNISTVATVACKNVNLDYQSNGGVLQMRGTTIINNSATFVGAGVVTTSGIAGAGFANWNGATYDFGVTAGPLTPTSITVKGGIVTAVS
jgi:hypothetical protein